jgi:putative nucleotidyltransferase with HDIG domain
VPPGAIVKSHPDPAPAAATTTLTLFVSAVIAVGVAVIGHSLFALPQVPNPVGWLALGFLAIVSASFALKIPGVPVYLSISDAFFITSALLFGAAPATLTIAIDSFIVSLRRGNTVRQLLFNSTSSALALWCGVQIYYVLSPPHVVDGHLSPDTTMLGPLAGLAAVYFLANSGLTAVAVALSKGTSVFQFWRRHFAVISINYFAAGSAAFFFIILVHYFGVAGIGAVVPLILVCHLAMRSWLGRVEDAQQHVARVNQLYMSTVSALSTAIEAKDGVTSDHVHRVRAYAMGLARALNITDSLMLQAIEAAALLHDTGKLAIPEHILNKPGKLTPSELETMQSHVNVGADILSAIDFPYPVVPIVRAHHENWDGSGYPDRLRGEQIPIGARILSVVDCFDALTSDRPYRPAMTEAAALDILVERRGTMYDPLVVDAFQRVFKDIEIPTPEPQLEAVTRNIRDAAAARAAERSQGAPIGIQAHSSDDLFGFVSLAGLASGSPTVRDIGVLAWSLLRPVTPEATFALFAVDDTKGSVIVRHIAGPAADRLSPMTIAVGERISGWTAATSRTMLNADASLELGKGFEDVLRWTLSVPLIADNGVMGVVTLYGREPFAQQAAFTIEMIAPHLVKALAAARSAEAESPSMTGKSGPHQTTPRVLNLVSRRASAGN